MCACGKDSTVGQTWPRPLATWGFDKLNPQSVDKLNQRGASAGVHPAVQGRVLCEFWVYSLGTIWDVGQADSTRRPVLQHQDPVGDRAGPVQVVGDENIEDVPLGLGRVEQFGDPDLDRDVQRR